MILYHSRGMIPTAKRSLPRTPNLSYGQHLLLTHRAISGNTTRAKKMVTSWKPVSPYTCESVGCRWRRSRRPRPCVRIPRSPARRLRRCGDLRVGRWLRAPRKHRICRHNKCRTGWFIYWSLSRLSNFRICRYWCMAGIYQRRRGKQNITTWRIIWCRSPFHICKYQFTVYYW